MNLKLNKKSISNILFVIAVIVLLYPPSREWFMRQIAFAPSVEKIENSEKIETLILIKERIKKEEREFLKAEVESVNQKLEKN